MRLAFASLATRIDRREFARTGEARSRRHHDQKFLPNLECYARFAGGHIGNTMVSRC